MNTNHKFLRGIGVALTATVLVASASVALASSHGKARTAGTGINVPTLILTSNGKPVSRLFAPPSQYNDIHFVWRPKDCKNGIQFPPVVLEWTYNGTHIDPAGNYYQPLLAPCRINDFEAGWIQDPATGLYRFTYTTWTYNGKVVKKIAFPTSANDFEMYWLKGGSIIKAWWTYNGKPVAPIQLPAGVVVNDAHFMLP